MKACIADAEQIIPDYMPMVDSLRLVLNNSFQFANKKSMFVSVYLSMYIFAIVATLFHLQL